MRSVVWSEDARKDYLGILVYIADQNPVAAEHVVDAIGRTAVGLGDFATGRPGRVSGTYEKPVANLPYIIAYAVSGDGPEKTVSILRVIHAARHWPDDASQ